MNKYLVFAVIICALALIDAKSTKNEEKSKKNTSGSFKNYQEIAQQFHDTSLNSTLFLNFLSSTDRLEATCSNVETKKETTIDEIGTCVKAIELGSDTLCSLIKKNFVKCSKSVIDLGESCLPTEFKGLPILAQKAILAIVNTACSSTFEEILEWLNPCSLELDPETFQTCKEIENVPNFSKNTSPKKSFVCSTYSKVRNCVNEISKTCKNTITKNSHKKFFEGIDNAIKDDCDEQNEA